MPTHSHLAFLALAAVPAILGFACPAGAVDVSSPDGRINVAFRLDPDGVPLYSVRLGNQTVLREAPLGVVCDGADFAKGLKFVPTPDVRPIREEYEILTAKRRKNTYVASRRAFGVATADGGRMDVVFQVSDDGVALRYEFPDAGGVRHVTREATTFRFAPETRAWLQPMSAAKTGWARTFPSYEEHYSQNVPVGTASPTGAGWVYPALFRSGDVWMLVSESNLSRNYCATRLVDGEAAGEYRVGFPDSREGFPGGPVEPRAAGAMTTPWRLVVIGSLKTVAESMLGVDLARPATGPLDGIRPGKASWSWVLLKDDQTVFDVQKRFVDYAADMGWRYCLVDALWDTQIGYDRIQELVEYAKTKDVGVLLWYNSAGDWNDAPQTPRDRMLTRESRVAEFERLKAMGVAGLKIDFFGGDGQSMVGYYLDILEDAAPYGFLLNFHGATLPRGLQRTYPHLMTMEAIRGEEFVTFGQGDADRQPAHAALLPFTRNVFDPMDFTPVVLDQLPGLERRTTGAFELALSVLFTSGIQHYAETPAGMAKAPGYVKQLLRDVPSVWDDTKFVGGFPGKDVTLARLGGGRWYVAGINADDAEKTLTLDLRDVPCAATGRLVTDGGGDGLGFGERQIELGDGRTLAVTLRPRGGFVAVFDAAPQ